VIDLSPSRYDVGERRLGSRTLVNAGYVSASDLKDDSPRVRMPFIRLLDHLLGCHGQAGSPWLSDGGGITPAWQEVGRRIQENFSLGYATDPDARVNPQEYFSHSVASYLQDRRGLLVADPPMGRLLRTTLLDDAFWKRADQQA
jgi:hypothetical protein